MHLHLKICDQEEKKQFIAEETEFLTERDENLVLLDLNEDQQLVYILNQYLQDVVGFELELKEGK